MQTQPSQVMQALRKWVQEEYKDKLQKEVDTSTWPIRCCLCFELVYCLRSKFVRSAQG